MEHQEFDPERKLRSHLISIKEEDLEVQIKSDQKNVKNKNEKGSNNTILSTLNLTESPSNSTLTNKNIIKEKVILKRESQHLEGLDKSKANPAKEIKVLNQELKLN